MKLELERFVGIEVSEPLVCELFECDDNLLQLIVDCTKFHFLKGFIYQY